MDSAGHVVRDGVMGPRPAGGGPSLVLTKRREFERVLKTHHCNE